MTKQDENVGIIPHGRIHLGAERTRVHVPGQEQAAKPEIIVIREGDAIKAIEVVCPCGQRTRINCIFG